MLLPYLYFLPLLDPWLTGSPAPKKTKIREIISSRLALSLGALYHPPQSSLPYLYPLPLLDTWLTGSPAPENKSKAILSSRLALSLDALYVKFASFRSGILFNVGT
jgi:hypothetical protein